MDRMPRRAALSAIREAGEAGNRTAALRLARAHKIPVTTAEHVFAEGKRIARIERKSEK